MNYILRTENLIKSYNNKRAVDGVSIHIRQGDIYGFLGQNGAGKTTTLRMIMGLITPTDGEIHLLGERVVAGRYRHYDKIGSVIETAGFYPNLTAIENLEIHRRLMQVTNKSYLTEALEAVGLSDVGNKKVKGFSLGMKQRLGIARSLLHKPELLILDEPTNGLDPVGIKEIRKLIISLSMERNITVLVSSHILSEVQQIATRIGIINEGKLLEEINVEDLKKKNRNYIEFKVNDDRAAALTLENGLNIHDYSITEQGIIRVYDWIDEAASINKVLNEQGILVHGINVKTDTLEDYFINLTGGNFNVS
jgi:bacitracin transport system ATP-binding protein